MISWIRALAAVALACALAACGLLAPRAAPDPQLDALFAALKDAPDATAAARAEQQIWAHWSRSGSATVDVLLDRAAAAQTNGDLRLARQFLREAGDLAPRYAEPWNRQATIAYDARDFTTAIDAIQETLKREPRHFGALTGLGLIYEEMGQTRAALEAYQSALAIHPYYDEARRGVARLSSQVNGTEA
ncbi:MAG: tetratricopeptide repeat protein [Hyphomonadaceae bacterium]|nr:tetratricopeptide repeat protein [Hyphomonadaceae bacterium]